MAIGSRAELLRARYTMREVSSELLVRKLSRRDEAQSATQIASSGSPGDRFPIQGLSVDTLPSRSAVAASSIGSDDNDKPGCNSTMMIYSGSRSALETAGVELDNGGIAGVPLPQARFGSSSGASRVGVCRAPATAYPTLKSPGSATVPIADLAS